MSKLPSFYKSSNNDFTLLCGDSRELLQKFEFQFDMIFADPPYFLSNGGISMSNGRKVCVDKGEWDKGGTPEHIARFNKEWLTVCRDKLKDNGTIWVSGTHHNIFSVAEALSELGFKILNVVTWAKTDPPDNLSHRMLTHSSEFIIWAKKSKRAQHRYNYEVMRQLNDGKQMTDVWYIPAVQKWEKSCGKHPTQKPLALMARIVLASTKEGDWILDPFSGSGTTGIASCLLGRRYLGIDQDMGFLELSASRRAELDNEEVRRAYQEKVLAECHTIEVGENRKMVLVGRVGSEEQWNWLMFSHLYNLPVSKVISMPKMLSVEYVLAFKGRDYENARLFRVGKLRPQIRTKDQIRVMTDNMYEPHRDSSYWVLRLTEPKGLDLSDRFFDRRSLIPDSANRGAYWIFKLEDVLEAFKPMALPLCP